MTSIANKDPSAPEYIAVSIEEVSTVTPDALKEVMAKVRKGRSRHKNDPDNTFQWGYEFSVPVENGPYLIRLVAKKISYAVRSEPVPSSEALMLLYKPPMDDMDKILSGLVAHLEEWL
jgi:hypothetical protein